jgi:hypothetical protein
MKKVYLCNCDNESENFNFRDMERCGNYKAIKKHAKEFDSVYTLEEFQDACNNEEIDLLNSFILID